MWHSGTIRTGAGPTAATPPYRGLTAALVRSWLRVWVGLSAYPDLHDAQRNADPFLVMSVGRDG
jgi:hypothetical protein